MRGNIKTSLEIFMCFMGWSSGMVGIPASYSSDPGVEILAPRSDILMEYFHGFAQFSQAKFRYIA
jgi:hypothetical protein